MWLRAYMSAAVRYGRGSRPLIFTYLILSSQPPVLLLFFSLFTEYFEVRLQSLPCSEFLVRDLHETFLVRPCSNFFGSRTLSRPPPAAAPPPRTTATSTTCCRPRSQQGCPRLATSALVADSTTLLRHHELYLRRATAATTIKAQR
jgi:hypothetical protein